VRPEQLVRRGRFSCRRPDHTGGISWQHCKVNGNQKRTEGFPRGQEPEGANITRSEGLGGFKSGQGVKKGGEKKGSECEMEVQEFTETAFLHVRGQNQGGSGKKGNHVREK